MDWKRKIAREWLWLGTSTLIVGSLWTLAVYLDPMAPTIGEFWESVIDLDSGFIYLAIAPIGLIYFIRLTVWAIKELKGKS